MGTSSAPPAEKSADTPAATAATAQSRDDGGPAPPPDKGAEPATDDSGIIGFELGKRVREATEIARYQRKPDDPIYRPLKIYTIDPSRHREEGQVAEINVPFEELKPGPVGHRFEVRKSGRAPFPRDYSEIDLDDPKLLITNGHDPAPTDPVFHHQMVYAVAMTTYAAFRTALGRQISWAFPGDLLVLVPHAFEGANALYDRSNGTLSFGWYTVKDDPEIDLPPGATIFACLSHDIIAHELTHALLDGLRSGFNRSNKDVGAFHEAFADLVALLLRFSYPTVVQNIVLRSQGDLKKDDDWLQFVYELAEGQGERSIRAIDLEGKLKYDPAAEEHALGTVLVSAIIDAFVTIYSRKTAAIFRLATGGRTGLAKDEAISRELLAQLTHIASRLASHLLTMCIRAIDYCPPVDMTLGEYLRALITADRDLVPDDPWAYREALVDAFRKRHVFPGGVSALTEDALLWNQPEKTVRISELNFENLKFADPGWAAGAGEAARQADYIGREVCKRANLHDFGLAEPGDDPAYKGDHMCEPVIESVRTSRRVGPDGQLSFDLIAEVTQRRQVQRPGEPGFEFMGGATLILGSEGQVRYVIAKNVRNEERLDRQRQFVAENDTVVYPLQGCRYQMRQEA